MAFLVPDPYATILAACDTIALSPELHLTRILQLLELTPRSVGSTHVAIFQKASFTFASTGRRNCASAAQPYPQVSKRRRLRTGHCRSLHGCSERCHSGFDELVIGGYAPDTFRSRARREFKLNG